MTFSYLFIYCPWRDYICNLPMSWENNINLRVSKEKLQVASGKAIHATVFKGFIGKRCRSSHGPYVPDRLKSTQLASNAALALSQKIHRCQTAQQNVGGSC